MALEVLTRCAFLLFFVGTLFKGTHDPLDSDFSLNKDHRMIELSIVVPIKNEESSLDAFCEHLHQLIVEELQGLVRVQVHLVVGSSKDQSGAIAKAQAEQKGWIFEKSVGTSIYSVVSSQFSKILHGYLMILPCDCRFSSGALLELNKKLQEGTDWGGFTKTYSPTNPILNFYGSGLNFWLAGRGHLVWTNVIFAKTQLITNAVDPQGGFLEDVQVSDQLRKQYTSQICTVPVIVNSRKYQFQGSLKLIFINGLIMMLYRVFRVSPKTLKKIYN